MPRDKDIVVEAREFIGRIGNCGLYPDKAQQIISSLADEVQALRRGEFICNRCHHRTDSEFEAGEF